MIKLGRMGIVTKVSLLPSHVALPEGHLDAAVHFIAHVGQRCNSRLMCDPSYPGNDHSIFKKCDWSEFYWDAKEVIPTNALEPEGKEVDICMCVESDQAGDNVSYRSRSGFLIHVNTALVQWYSKKQSTVETSVFCVEFVALKQGIHAVRLKI